MIEGRDNVTNFYDTWLGFWNRSEEEKQRAKSVIHEEELEWMRTLQDHRVALLCAPETGFRTWGTETLVAEIPVGCHTGRHVHGEEGIFILEGEGFSTIKLAGDEGPGRGFRWSKGATIWIPFGAEHQHFNTGNAPVRYFSISALHLEHWLGFGKLDQVEECGETLSLPQVTIESSGLDAKDRRIVLPWDSDRYNQGQSGVNLHARNAPLMRSGLGFKNFEIQVWGVLTKGKDSPGQRFSGKHAHMEAILYVLDGAGYTIIDGKRVDWKKGSCLQIAGPQTVHEHFCASDEPYSLLRCAPGVRMHFAHHFALERFPYLRFTPDGVKEVRDAAAASQYGN